MYKVVFDYGKPFKVLKQLYNGNHLKDAELERAVMCDNYKTLKRTLKDFYIEAKEKDEQINVFVFNDKDEDISENQFITELIGEILDEVEGEEEEE